MKPRSPSTAAVSVSVPTITAGVIRICDRCRRELLQPLARKSARLDTWRSAHKDMLRAETSDPRAEKIKRKKEKKKSLRSITREIGIVGAITMLLRGSDDAPPAYAREGDDDCQRCLELNQTVNQASVFRPLPGTIAATA